MDESNDLSCDPSIYRAGGFPGDQHHLEGLRARKAPEIVTVATLYEPSRYGRSLDQAAIFGDAALKPRLAAALAAAGGGPVVAPACVVVRIEGACIRDRGITIQRDGASLPLFETYRPADLYAVGMPGPCHAPQVLPDTHAYLLLTSSGTFNWGHWLAEDLPRFRAVSRIAAGRPLCVLMHGFVPAIDRRKIELMRALSERADVQLRLLRPDTAYRAADLYFVSPVSGQPGPKHPDALADLAAAGEALIRRQAKRWWRLIPVRPKRIFVTRRAARGRVPVAWDEICTLLQARGYRPFDPEGAPALEQVAVFAGAEAVVGCMGAAMVNTLFCRPGTPVLHLAPDSFPDPYFLDLAAARGHRYGVCYGTALDPTRPSQTTYVLDPAHLDRALAWLDGGAQRSAA